MCWILHFFKRFQSLKLKLYSILVNEISIAFYIYLILCYYLYTVVHPCFKLRIL